VSTTLIRSPREIASGAWHIPDWLTPHQQRRVVSTWRMYAFGPLPHRIPMRHIPMPNGSAMSAQTVCLGWNWKPYKYTKTADDLDGALVSGFPAWLGNIARAAVAAAYEDPEAGYQYRPDAALINYYEGSAKLGMHQDKDERTNAPVVSLSVGDACIFRFGNTANRKAPYTDIELQSGDLVVFGRESRYAYHGIPSPIQPGTADPAIGRINGRLNYTIRETGLS
jgi:alkylated DNA repair protein (DNA oxidative demethylase)